MRVRIQSVTFKHFKNLFSGKIRFPCNLKSDIFSLNSDVLGIYGPNGSGKTAFIDALKILKYLLSGIPIKECLSNCITIGYSEAELSFELSIEDDHRNKFRTVYSVQIGMDYLNESVKASELQNNLWSRMNSIMVNRAADYKTAITPTGRRNDLCVKDSLYELRLIKRLCAKEHRSFLFSDEVLALLQIKSNHTSWYSMFAAIRHFAKTSLFVIDNQNTHLNSIGTMFPLIFQTGNSIRQLNLPLDRHTVIQDKEYVLAEQAVAATNTVLCKIVPDIGVALDSLDKEHTENRNLGVRVHLMALKSGKNGTISLPLKYESAGIKKIASLLPLLICTYNNPGITLAIDELDSNIYEHLLGELLRIMQDSGQGQLIFTSHNLRPLEVAIIMNIDRHYGNFGVLFDTGTLKILGMSPVFDHNRSLLPELNNNQIVDSACYLRHCKPKLGQNFIGNAKRLLTNSIRQDLLELKDFEFQQHNDILVKQERLDALSRIVQERIRLILSDSFHTYIN